MQDSKCGSTRLGVMTCGIFIHKSDILTHICNIAIGKQDDQSQALNSGNFGNGQLNDNPLHRGSQILTVFS
jgi:hypothetical protein